MYLLPSTSEQVNNRKWNLARLGMAPTRLPNLGILNPRAGESWRMRGLRGLGQDSTDIDFATGLPCDDPRANCGSQTYVLAPGQPGAPGAYVPPALNTPTTASGVQNPNPVSGGASNGGLTTVFATKPSTNPLDYVSPQAAIAAGLDPQTVYNAWTAALAKFPSPQAAISAGVPAGVVNQLWQQANVNAANKAAASASSGFFGLSTGTLLAIGGGVAALALLGGRKRR